MAKVLVVISAAKQDQYSYSINAPICGTDGQPLMVNVNGNWIPVTAKTAAICCALGLPVPRTEQDVVDSLAYVKRNAPNWECLEFTADRLYKDEDDEYTNNFLLEGWEDWEEDDQKRLWIRNAHLKLNLTSLSSKAFGFYNGTDNRWLHINTNLGEYDGTLDAKGVATIAQYQNTAVASSAQRTCVQSADGTRSWNHRWEVKNVKFIGQDGKPHGLFFPTIRIKGGSAFYALIEQKDSGNWGTVPINLVKHDGTALRFKDGKQVTQQGWGFINSTLYPWASCVPSSWEVKKKGPKSSNRKFC